MKKLIFYLLLLLHLAMGSSAQGVPQYMLGNPNPVPIYSDSVFNVANGWFNGCDKYIYQYAYQASWFAPSLPLQGTITDIFFRMPGDTLEALWGLDTVLANSIIRGARIRMGVTQLDTIYTSTLCRRLQNLTQVFDVPVFYVPTALQGDDSTNCWIRLPLTTPFTYNLTTPIDEDDTATIHKLVVEMIADSNMIMRNDLNPTAHTSTFSMREYVMRGAAFHLSVLEVEAGSACPSSPIHTCSNWGQTPVIGFNLAPNSVQDVSASQVGGVYPNPVGKEGLLHVKPLLRGKPYKLYSMSGQMVSEGTTSSAGIDMSALPSGVYLLYCERQRFKVVK